MGKIKKINWLDFLIPAILLTGFTILFRFTNLDISWQSYFWKESSGWFLKNAQPWHFLYHYSNLPALVISIAALMVLAIGFFKNRWRKYKKICLFLVLVIIIGPGLIINSLLKDNWGRPRPRDIEAFGGEYDYEQVLEINPESSGKSFPCGHCSMGFYFFVLFLLLRKSFKTTAFLLLLFGIILGSLIGIARLAQGGHFISDILWTAGLVYMSSAALYYLLGM
ncbi:MAG: phosphatase PAP2 family protein, partial [Candidatus Cloacimonadota bacterium]|nr:phosphatase PAP2 family protein [Candidatus Cloacimonadota bacterium]